MQDPQALGKKNLQSDWQSCANNCTIIYKCIHIILNAYKCQCIGVSLSQCVYATHLIAIGDSTQLVVSVYTTVHGH